jgi:hypothetical protein
MATRRAEGWQELPGNRHVLHCYNGKQYIVQPGSEGDWVVADPYTATIGPYRSVGAAKDAAELRAHDQDDRFH